MRITKLNDLIEDGRVLKGKWELDKKHHIQFKRKDRKEEVKLRATILDVTPAALILSHTTRQDDQTVVTRIQKLKGIWRADSKNRLTFEVQRRRGRSDVLTFKNAWKINKNQELQYTYKEEQLKTRKKITRNLVFKGYWDITQKNRITYSLGKNTGSYFKFRGAFQSKSLRAKKGEIRYQVGIEVEKKIKRTRTIVLFGKWKYSRKLGLHFNVKYKNGRKHAIVFGATFDFIKNHRVEINLKDRKGKSLGVELVLTRDFLKGEGQTFVRYLGNMDESRIEAGVRFGW